VDIGSEVQEKPAALIRELTQAWSGGDAVAFGRPFDSKAIFVAFDGTVLRGPEAISSFHQQAFSTHLAGTQLHVEIDEIRAIAAGVAIALTHGGIRRNGQTQGPLIGASIQTFIFRETNGRFLIESFQNTRARSITGPREAQVWRDFDLAWSRLRESGATSN